MITDLKNAFIGDSSISRIYQGNNLVYVDGHPDILCEYLQADEESSTAERCNVWFDTGYTPYNPAGVEIKWQLPTNNSLYSSSVEGCIYGCQEPSSTHYLMSPSTNKQIRYANMSTTTDTHTYSTSAVTACVTCSGTTQNIRVSNGLSVSATASSSKTFSKTCYIFGLNNNGTCSTRAYAGTRIFYVKIIDTQNRNLIRYFVPVLHWDGSKYVPCFFEECNRVYHYNLGTGNVYYKIRDNDYLLDWIGTSETAGGGSPQVYFNTGIAVAPVMANHLRFINGGNGTVSENYIVGVRKSGSAKYGIFCPANSNNTLSFISPLSSSSSNTLDFQTGKNVPDAEIKATATHYSTSTGRSLCYNGTVVTNTNKEESGGAVIGCPIAIFGINADDLSRVNNKQGTKVQYYSNSLAIATPASVHNFLPVLHNGVPAFLDINTNSYKYNTGTDAPAIKFLLGVDGSKQDIPLRGIASAATRQSTLNNINYSLSSKYTTDVATEIYVTFTLDESVINTSGSCNIIGSNDDESLWGARILVNNNTNYKGIQFYVGDWSNDEEVGVGATYDLQPGVEYTFKMGISGVNPGSPYITFNNNTYSASTTIDRTKYSGNYLSVFGFTSRQNYGGVYIKQILWYDDGDIENVYRAVLHWDGTTWVPCFTNTEKDSGTTTYIYHTGTGTPAYSL